MYSKQMPVIDLDVLNWMEREMAAGIVATQGKNKGRLRASKPKVTRREIDGTVQPDSKEGQTAYIWRMVAFSVSPKPQHQCMPCTAEWDLPGLHSERRELVKMLDRIVDQIVDSVPKTEWHGVQRWGQVFGQIGQPQLNDEGAIIYR